MSSATTTRFGKLEAGVRESKKRVEIFKWAAEVHERHLLQLLLMTDPPTTPEEQERLAQLQLAHIEGRETTPEEQEVLTQLELAIAEGVHVEGAPGELQELRFNTAWDLYIKLRKAVHKVNKGGKPC